MNCGSCGRANRDDARFCDGCGTRLGDATTVDSGARKVVTIVFADLAGSTSLHERLDAESTRRLMDRYYRSLREVVEAHRGTVVKLLGDGVMAAFGVPMVSEDDAVRAVRAAVAMQQAFRELLREQVGVAVDLGLRVAVNTGEVVVSPDHTDVVGDPVNVAARLQQEAHEGDVLIGESTRRLVSDLVTLAPFGSLVLKGRSETVAAYRVLSLERPARATATPLVGREEEVRRLTAVYDDAAGSPAARLAVILGSPGLGKSRLLAEMAHRLGEQATLLEVRCDNTAGPTLAPLAATLRAFLHPTGADGVRTAVDAAIGGEESERARIAAGLTALLSSTPAAAEETFFVVRRLLAGLAAQRPVVLSIDDLQWAEPLLLDLIEHLVQWSGDSPLFLLAAARPELREVRAALIAPGGAASEVITLAGLDAGAAARLAANAIGADVLPAAIAGRVLATSEGNPLFVGELVRMLVDDGVLRREGERWTTDAELADLAMPPTIQALLGARLERLRPEDRTLLERAAVVGRQFSRSAVAHLLPQENDLDASLESLRRGELIEAGGGTFLGEPLLRFHHLLVRDAAYRRLLKGKRAELHGRFAAWLEERVAGAVEHEEIIGWHFEQAHQHLLELGPIDADGRRLGERAAHYLGAAGRRALGRDDLARAAGLLGRALNRLESDDAGRAELTLDWCEALLAGGDVGPAAEAIAALGRALEGNTGAARLRAWKTCFEGQLSVLTDPQVLHETADAVAAAAEDLAGLGDAAGEAKAHSVQALALARLGAIGGAEAALDRALAAARRAQDRRRANAVLAGAPLAALWGPSPVTRASGRCLDVVRVLRITQGAPAVEAVALRCQGVLEALRGRLDAARSMIASSRHMVEELGLTQRLLEADVFAGLVELLEGDAVAAEQRLRGAYEGLRRHGLGIDAAHAAALLGRALLAQDRAEEAEQLSHEGEALAGDDLKAAIAWRGVRAEALARRGEHTDAVALARAAVDIATTTDALLDHADARLALAVALRADDRAEEAAQEEARAIELWEAKGATLLADRARGGAPREASTATLEAPAATQRRVRANAATANTARLAAAIAACDADAFEGLLADPSEVVHHPTSAVYDRRGALGAWRAMLRAENVSFVQEPLASLGESLALCRTTVSFDALGADDLAPFGAVAKKEILLLEVDGRGQRTRAEFFDEERLGDALAQLYARHAEVTHGEREAATATSAATVLGQIDLDRYATSIAPDVEFVDHRLVGYPSGRGKDALLQTLGTLVETADTTATRVNDVLAAAPNAFVLHWTTAGNDRRSGGAFEWQFLRLCVFDDAGLLCRAEQFDVDRVDDALARFDAVTAAYPLACFENAACASIEQMERAWERRDWETVATLQAPGFRMEDRRALVGLTLSGEDFVANVRMMFELPASRWHNRLLATRGERLALFAVRFEGETRAGDRLEFPHLSVVEVDKAGRHIALVVFDGDDLAAAYAELEARYAAGEGAPFAPFLRARSELERAIGAFDLDELARLLPDDFTIRSRRRFANAGAPLGREAYLESLRVQASLGVHADLRANHLRLSPTAAIGVSGWSGHRDGGAFEVEWVFVYAHDGERFHASELFDLDQLDEARARFAQLSATPTDGDEARLVARRDALTVAFGGAFERRDWAALSELLTPDLVATDHRPLGWEPLHGRDAYLDAVRLLVDLAPDVHLRIEHLAIRAPRFLYLTTWFGTRDGGAFESPSAIVCELDASERICRLDQFELSDLDRAKAYLDGRHEEEPDQAAPALSALLPPETRANAACAAGERAHQAFAARDEAAARALFAPEAGIEDRRALGRFSLDLDQWLADQQRGRADIPDLRYERRLVGTAGDRIDLESILWRGGPRGGEVELEYLRLTEVDAAGRILNLISFSPEDWRSAQAEAWQRWFAREPHAEVVFAPLFRLVTAIDDRDAAAVRAALAADVVVDDHRSGAGRLALDAYLESLQALWEQSRDVQLQVQFEIAHDDRGCVGLGRLFGTTAEGDTFDHPVAVAARVADGRVARLEIFDGSELDAARRCLGAW